VLKKRIECQPGCGLPYVKMGGDEARNTKKPTGGRKNPGVESGPGISLPRKEEKGGLITGQHTTDLPKTSTSKDLVGGGGGGGGEALFKKGVEPACTPSLWNTTR